ncbi:MAG: helix-turn-helix transcriptional regulator [Lentisphaerae bacterium]|nr:helix-turn-helix transcriptional regulator [Lentisphaerota bacterium]
MTVENFEKDFIGAIRTRLSEMTEREMGKRSGVASSYLNSLKNGKKLPRALSVETLLKLFPNAQISLNSGDTITGNASSNYGPAVGNNFGGSVVMNPTAAFDEIITAVMASDLDSESKVKVFNIVNQIKQGKKA